MPNEEVRIPRWWSWLISAMLVVLSILMVWLVVATVQHIEAAWRIVEQAEHESRHACTDGTSRQCVSQP